jgi:hypothetical protein
MRSLVADRRGRGRLRASQQMVMRRASHAEASPPAGGVPDPPAVLVVRVPVVRGGVGRAVIDPARPVADELFVDVYITGTTSYFPSSHSPADMGT